ncbi:MAG TPA: TolC family protein [Kofleriaceae bacterium]|nr:TolC family protein [Kofleriaceae bacterium]
MRLARFAPGVLAILTFAAPAARADVLGRALRLVDAPGAGAASPAPAPTPPSSSAPPPEQVPDLSAWAGESRATSLPELLKTAINQAPALANARIDIAIAEAQIQQTWARNDYLVRAQLQGQRAVQPGRGTVTDVNASVDLTRMLPSGGTFGLHVDSIYGNIADSPFGDIENGTTWISDVTATINQPLLRNRGSRIFDANEAKASLTRDVDVLARRLAAIQTVQNVISAYWDLVLAERQIGITQASLDLARERLRVTTIGTDGGKTARSEIPAVLQIIATREEDVLNGELAVLNASIALRRAAGMQIGGGELGLRIPTDLDAREQALDLAGLTERAYAASPELAELAKQDASAQIDLAVTENDLLPQLDAALSIGPTGSSPNADKLAGLPRGAPFPSGSFQGAWKDLVELNAVTVVGSLTFTQSIGRNDVYGKQKQFREQRRKLVVNAFDLRANIAQTMARGVAQIELAKRRVALSQQAIDLANQNIKIETDRFNLGRSTNFDVLNRLEDLRQAELRKAQALVDWHKAEVVVQALTGDILPMYGIAVQ